MLLKEVFLKVHATTGLPGLAWLFSGLGLKIAIPVPVTGKLNARTCMQKGMPFLPHARYNR